MSNFPGPAMQAIFAESMSSSLATSALSIPPSLAWYCNAAHVTASNYQRSTEARKADAELVHLVYVQRHHKRTPDNLVPGIENRLNPREGWVCDDFERFNYGTGGKGSARIQAISDIPAWNPFLPLFWNGTCDQGQLTAGGLADSYEHGKDLWSVYGPGGANALLHHASEDDIYVRTSPSDRTMQVTGGLLRGMGYPNDKPFEVHVSPAKLDGIVPSYSCSKADALRTTINAEPEWTSHIQGKAGLFAAVNEVLQTANASDWNSWIDHAFDFLASRQCHNHPLPTNEANGKSISQSLADEVYAEGNWEYNYIWNASPNADEYVRYSFGVFVQELARRLRAIKDGKDNHKLTAFIGHDGTMVRLFKTLAQPKILWPGLGSEAIFEVYETRSSKAMHVRILAYGTTLTSSASQLTGKNEPAEVAWVPIDDLIAYLDARVPSDLYEKCTA